MAAAHPVAAQSDLLVDSLKTNQVLRYNGTTGAFEGIFISGGSGGLTSPVGIAFNPNGNVVVGSSTAGSPPNDVYRFLGTSGALDPSPGNSGALFATGGGLTDIQGITYGPDGNLYVTSAQTNRILRYSGSTGTFLGTFITASSNGLFTKSKALFGPGNSLYVSSFSTNQVLRYDAGTGALLSAFVSAGSGGLAGPEGLTFGPDGNLYVVGDTANDVLEFSGTTGAFISTFVAGGAGGLSGPGELQFGPDGDLYVESFSAGDILRYNGTTGAFINNFVSAGAGGLSGPAGFAFSPAPHSAAVPAPGSLSLLGLGLIPMFLLTARWQRRWD